MSNRDLKHDLKEAIETLKLAVEDIERGYRFDDEFAEAKKQTIRRSVDRLYPFVREQIDKL